MVLLLLLSFFWFFWFMVHLLSFFVICISLAFCAHQMFSGVLLNIPNARTHMTGFSIRRQWEDPSTQSYWSFCWVGWSCLRDWQEWMGKVLSRNVSYREDQIYEVYQAWRFYKESYTCLIQWRVNRSIWGTRLRQMGDKGRSVHLHSIAGLDCS